MVEQYGSGFNLRDDIASIWKDPTYHDVTIVCADGVELGACRAVLASRCPVFKAMLYGNMREGYSHRVALNDITSTVLNIVLGFIHTEAIDITVTNSIAVGIYHAASFLLLQKLMEMVLERAHDLADSGFASSLLNEAVAAIPWSEASKDLYDVLLNPFRTHKLAIGELSDLSEESLELLLTESATLSTPEHDLLLCVVHWFWRSNENTSASERRTILHDINDVVAGRAGTVRLGDGTSRALMLKMMSHFDLTLVCPNRLKTFTETVDNFAETSPHYMAFCHHACKNTLCPTRQILPDLDHDVEDFQVFHWKIESWRALTGRVYSPEFEAGGWKWKIMLFPLGNNQKESTSMYLQLVDPGPSEQGKHSCAQFALVISNPFDPTQLKHRSAHNRFCADKPNLGFTRFCDIKKMFQPNDGRSYPLIDDDQTVISAFVRVLKDHTGVLWHNFVSYDSRKVTGFVGLLNQGTTSYLNTAVQCLYMIKFFCRAVYKIPTESDVPTKNVALALQRVFYNLQFSEVAVGTTELTRSFGWDFLDTSMEREFLEFNRILQEILESKMKNTPADGDMKKLFIGKMKTYVKGISIDYEFSRVEDYYDIQLDVKGCKNLYESFVKFVAEFVEKQQIGDHGLQNVKRGVYFESFPSVLYVQLKRFEYDISKDTMVKINGRHEFPPEIDLEEFLSPIADRNGPHKYLLHGVIVHSGDLDGGQYFAFLKPKKDNKWFKYEGQRVTPVTDLEVFEDNYGGEAPNANQLVARRPQMAAKRRFTSAYALVYIRESDVDEMLAPISPGDIPPHIEMHLDEENKTHLTAKVVTDDIFKVHQGFDLANFDDKTMQSEIPSFRVKKEERFSVFKQSVADHFQVPVNRFRLWILVNRYNRTVRPDQPISETEANSSMEFIQTRMDAYQSTLRLYLEETYMPISDKLSTLKGVFAHPSLMIFIKYFDPKTQIIEGCGKLYVKRNGKVRDIIPILNMKKGFPLNTALKLFEEIKPSMIDPMKTPTTFQQAEIQDGDIICFQKEISDREAAEYKLQGYAATIIEFFGQLVKK